MCLLDVSSWGWLEFDILSEWFFAHAIALRRFQRRFWVYRLGGEGFGLGGTPVEGEAHQGFRWRSRWKAADKAGFALNDAGCALDQS